MSHDLSPPALLAWFADHGRDLPWRATREPWAVLVSEVMLQQTQASRVEPKWRAFVATWPDATACAASPLGAVLRVWEGLGYPNRARRLWETAGVLVRDHGGRVPDDLDDLLRLPGVGHYTARAVLAFAFERDVAVLDTHVGRVLARTGGRRLSPGEAQRTADAAVPGGAGWAWNQALLELGATICTARSPRCAACPVATGCRWRGVGPDPAIGSAATSRRQPRFEGSDRQLRGRILRAVAAGPMPLDELDAAVGSGDDRGRTARLVEALAADGLLDHRGDGTVRLP